MYYLEIKMFTFESENIFELSESKGKKLRVSLCDKAEVIFPNRNVRIKMMPLLDFYSVAY